MGSLASAKNRTKRFPKDPNPTKGDKRIVQPFAKVKNPDLNDLLNRLLKHKPTTDILERAKEAHKKGTILTRVLVTVEMAMDLMGLNDPTKQRDLKYTYLERYVKDHINGTWKYNGECLTISKGNRLLNGQKRLLAIILSKKPQIYHIEWGLEDDLDTQDIGQSRSAQDALKMMGIDVDANIMQAAIKKIMMYYKFSTIKGNIHQTVFSPADVTDWIKDTRNRTHELASFVNIAMSKLKENNKYFSASEWAFLWYILSNKHGRKSEAEKFIYMLSDGQRIAQTGKTAAIWAARRYIASPIKSAKKGTHKYQTAIVMKMKYSIRGWNLWVTSSREDLSAGIKLEKEYEHDNTLEITK